MEKEGAKPEHKPQGQQKGGPTNQKQATQQETLL